MKTHVEVIKSGLTTPITWDRIANGDWFINCRGFLGVKVDGFGFYPTTGKRGFGIADRDGLATPVARVSIIVEPDVTR